MDQLFLQVHASLIKVRLMYKKKKSTYKSCELATCQENMLKLRNNKIKIKTGVRVDLIIAFFFKKKEVLGSEK